MVMPPDTLSTIPNGIRTDAVAAVVSEDGTVTVLVLHSDSEADGVAELVGIVEEDSLDSEEAVAVVAVEGSSEVAEAIGVAVRQDSSESCVEDSAGSGADDDSLGITVISLVDGRVSSATAGDPVLARTATQKVRLENFMVGNGIGVCC